MRFHKTNLIIKVLFLHFIVVLVLWIITGSEYCRNWLLSIGVGLPFFLVTIFNFTNNKYLKTKKLHYEHIKSDMEKKNLDQINKIKKINFYKVEKEYLSAVKNQEIIIDVTLILRGIILLFGIIYVLRSGIYSNV